MIIVSQDREYITENLEIHIRNGIDDEGNYFAAIDNLKRTLGIYKSTEKAKEGLNCKEAILKELNQGKVAKFKVITNNYYLEMQIKERKGE